MTKTNISNIGLINRFLLRSDKKVFIFIGVSIVALLFSYAFLLSSRLYVKYALESGEINLVSITSSNSILESKLFVQKEKTSDSVEIQLVAVRNVSYLDSSFERLVINR
jgi:hypothetical protein